MHYTQQNEADSPVCVRVLTDNFFPDIFHEYAQFLCYTWNTFHITHKNASYELTAANNKVSDMIYNDTLTNAQFWVNTALLLWNITNSYMVWSLWDDHQGVHTSNDPVLRC